MSQPLDPNSQEAIRLRYLKVDTANVADVLDELGLPDQAVSPQFQPFPANAGKLAGWAHTIRGEMRPYPLADRDPDKLAALSGLKPGSVSVWAGSGEGVCFFGELIVVGMQESGCVGALVDGGIRDVAWIGERGFPVFARYRTPVQSIGRWKVIDSLVPVRMPGATVDEVEVQPGDFILADDDGGIVIPADRASEVLGEAERLGQKEIEIRQELAAGLSLQDALEKFGHI